MIITFRNKIQSIDCKVDQDQRVIDVLNVLKENGQLAIELDNLCYVYSKRNQEQINVQCRFIDAKIYHADTIEV